MSFFLISIVILIITSVMYIASFWITAINTGSFDKLSAYECGFSPMGNSRMAFEVLFYLVGLLYLIFDLEVIFLFPLATIMFSLDNLLAFWSVNIFFIIVSIGFIYEYNMGALDFTTHTSAYPSEGSLSNATNNNSSNRY